MNLSDILNPLKLGFDLIKEWRKKEIIHISPLLAIEKEHIHKKLKEEGYEFCWAPKHKIRNKKAEDWNEVTERSALWRKKIFMDKNEELTLMCRKKI